MFNAVVFSRSHPRANVLVWLNVDGTPLERAVQLDGDPAIPFDSLMLVTAVSLSAEEVLISGPAKTFGVHEDGDSVTVMRIVKAGKFPEVVRNLFKMAQPTHAN